MNEEMEITLKVKPDTYKQLRNYLHNELGISKEYIEGLVKQYVRTIAIEILMDDNSYFRKEVNKILQKTTAEKIDNLYYQNMDKYKFRDDVKTAIFDIVKPYVLKVALEELKGE